MGLESPAGQTSPECRHGHGTTNPFPTPRRQTLGHGERSSRPFPPPSPLLPRRLLVSYEGGMTKVCAYLYLPLAVADAAGRTACSCPPDLGGRGARTSLLSLRAQSFYRSFCRLYTASVLMSSVTSSLPNRKEGSVTLIST